jgi:hypothetical protein
MRPLRNCLPSLQVTSVCFSTHLASAIRRTHMSQHHRSASGKETPDQEPSQYQEYDV